MHNNILVLGPVYVTDFAPGRKSSRDEFISVYGQYVVAVYMVWSRDDFIPVLRTGMKFYLAWAIDIEKLFDKTITIDINHVNIIEKSILTTLLVITVINVIDFIDGC